MRTLAVLVLRLSTLHSLRAGIASRRMLSPSSACTHCACRMHALLLRTASAGGDLFHYVRARGHLIEAEARWFFQQIVLALDYCHRMVSRHPSPAIHALIGRHWPASPHCCYGRPPALRQLLTCWAPRRA